MLHVVYLPCVKCQKQVIVSKPVEYNPVTHAGKTLMLKNTLDRELMNEPSMCLSQGSFFKDKSIVPAFVDGLSAPNDHTHGHFYGLFVNHCCVCALDNGWNVRSFYDVGCFVCTGAKLAVIEAFLMGMKKHGYVPKGKTNRIVLKYELLLYILEKLAPNKHVADKFIQSLGM